MGIAESAWDGIEGLDVFTSDEEKIGEVRQVISPPDDPAQHFLLIEAGELAAILGTNRLFVPDEDVLSVETDRIVLDATADAINRPDWTTPPVGYES